MILRKNKGFMLTEIILGMTVFAIIMTTVLLSVESMSIARIKTENRVTIIEDLYSFGERLISTIKEGGTLDYEEYWNRISYDTQIASGHYIRPTGVGNYGSGGDLSTNFGGGLYYCISTGSTSRITAGSGCLEGKNISSINAGGTIDINYSGSYQRYGQYAIQFTDWNGNADSDRGDEDNDTNFDIRNDEDDKDLGNGPIVLSGSMPELYLIDPELKTRTYFRWIVRTDPNAPSGVNCIFSGPNMGSGCVGNVQILRLEGKDLGELHSGSVANNFGAFDGKIDTWVCHRDWTCAGPSFVALGTQRIATGKDSEWVDIFPDTINVKSIKFSAYPLKNPWLSWGAKDATATEISPFIHPYVRMQLTIGFAWGKRRTLKDDDPTISINTTVNLGDF